MKITLAWAMLVVGKKEMIEGINKEYLETSLRLDTNRNESVETRSVIVIGNPVLPCIWRIGNKSDNIRRELVIG